MPGEIYNGDFAAASHEANSSFFVVLDGLGHGVGAFRSARLAARVCRTANTGGLRATVLEVHKALDGAQMGCVAFLGTIQCDDNLEDGLPRLTYCIIGDVQGMLVGLDGGMLSQQPGCLGVRIPTPRIESRILDRNDMCLIATDGVSMTKLRGFLDVEPIPHPPERQEWIDRALSHAARANDDATLMLLGNCNVG